MKKVLFLHYSAYQSQKLGVGLKLVSIGLNLLLGNSIFFPQIRGHRVSKNKCCFLGKNNIDFVRQVQISLSLIPWLFGQLDTRGLGRELRQDVLENALYFEPLNFHSCQKTVFHIKADIFSWNLRPYWGKNSGLWRSPKWPRSRGEKMFSMVF